jgi:tetratricopeptide (TPR) repeat protein
MSRPPTHRRLCNTRAGSTGQRSLRGLILAAALLPAIALAQAPGDKKAATDKLLDALKAAPTEAIARPLEEQIRQAWLGQTTPAVRLLISRGMRELKAGSFDEAVDAFSDAITLDPTLAEAWHHRAIARYQSGDPMGAISDIEETLKREPRNFAAFRTLSNIAAQREDWKNAYAAWEKLLALDPKTPGGEARLKELKRKAFGEDA